MASNSSECLEGRRVSVEVEGRALLMGLRRVKNIPSLVRDGRWRGGGRFVVWLGVTKPEGVFPVGSGAGGIGGAFRWRGESHRVHGMVPPSDPGQ